MSAPTKNRFFAAKKRPLVLGHRGAPWLHQENSLAGLRRALELGADGVEFDVFLTRDDKVVVFHDEELERLTGHKGRVGDHTWDELSKLRLQRRVHMGKNAKGEEVVLTFEREERIPLLEEVLDELKGRAVMDIELKPGAPSSSGRSVGQRVAEIVERMGIGDHAVITGFDFFKLAAVEKKHAALHTGFAYDDNALDSLERLLGQIPELPSSVSRARGNQNVETLLNWLLELNTVGRFIGSSVVNVEHTLLDEDSASRFKKRGMAVGAYTLFPLDTQYVKQLQSDEEQAERARWLAAHGVDWFETDDPVKLQEALSAG
jgi:glycerophosphoryl diester phosphodiesterase